MVHNIASDVVYAIFLSWSDNFTLELGDVAATDQTKATLLGYTGAVEIVVMNKSGAQGINVTLPHLPPNTPCTAVGLDVEARACGHKGAFELYWNNKRQQYILK